MFATLMLLWKHFITSSSLSYLLKISKSSNISLLSFTRDSSNFSYNMTKLGYLNMLVGIASYVPISL
jgi:hypothetical protein